MRSRKRKNRSRSRKRKNRSRSRERKNRSRSSFFVFFVISKRPTLFFPSSSFSFFSSRTLTLSTMTSGPDTPLTVRYSVDEKWGGRERVGMIRRARQKKRERKEATGIVDIVVVGRMKSWAALSFLPSCSAVPQTSTTHRAWAPGCSPSMRRRSAP